MLLQSQPRIRQHKLIYNYIMCETYTMEASQKKREISSQGQIPGIYKVVPTYCLKKDLRLQCREGEPRQSMKDSLMSET